MRTTTTLSLLVLGTLVLSAGGVQQAAQEKYHSPYSVAFSYPKAELLADFQGMRGDWRQSSIVPFGDWYSAHTRKRYGHWGPPARHYEAPHGVAGRPLKWQRERVIAVATRYIGYGYQHHHLPDWNPPAGWPWGKTATGHNGKGVDCSNFTAFVYNLGFGIKPSSAIGKQAAGLEVPGTSKVIRAERIALADDYASWVQVLRTGDLLFIRNREGRISHVVLWVGGIGRAPDNIPLILDSHGEGVKDSSGQVIPAGVHLRPFREKSWYFRSASHAIRILHGKFGSESR